MSGAIYVVKFPHAFSEKNKSAKDLSKSEFDNYIVQNTNIFIPPFKIKR